jgi:hypothetical protein
VYLLRVRRRSPQSLSELWLNIPNYSRVWIASPPYSFSTAI